MVELLFIVPINYMFINKKQKNYVFRLILDLTYRVYFLMDGGFT